jgi:hypothetical protein
MYLAMALPNVALVAGDTRVTFPYSPHEDGYRKIAPFAGGWVVGGLVGAALERLAPMLVGCKTPEAMHIDWHRFAAGGFRRAGSLRRYREPRYVHDFFKRGLASVDNRREAAGMTAPYIDPRKEMNG